MANFLNFYRSGLQQIQATVKPAPAPAPASTAAPAQTGPSPVGRSLAAPMPVAQTAPSPPTSGIGVLPAGTPRQNIVSTPTAQYVEAPKPTGIGVFPAGTGRENFVSIPNVGFVPQASLPPAAVGIRNVQVPPGLGGIPPGLAGDGFLPPGLERFTRFRGKFAEQETEASGGATGSGGFGGLTVGQTVALAGIGAAAYFFLR